MAAAIPNVVARCGMPMDDFDQPATLDQGVLDQRRTGILLAVTALPGPHDHGDFSHAFKFIEFLHEAGITIWQLLPLGPTHVDLCPYQCLSAHAGNPLLINLESLCQHGLLEVAELPETVTELSRRNCLKQASRRFHADTKFQLGYNKFKQQHDYWLHDFALFMAIRQEQHDRPWFEWTQPLRDQHAEALYQAEQRLAARIEQINFEQFIFAQQWSQVKAFAHRKGIRLFGDMPLFVAHDSADVWANRSDFLLDECGHPKVVAGVPPDYFSSEGQRWDNPHFAWQYQQEQGFHWWLKRLQSELERYDLLRIDHFRGLTGSWAIPFDAASPKEGHWLEVPGRALLETVAAQIMQPRGYMPLIAEDLGVITDEVNQLRNQFRLPGMKVLQFAFDGNDDNPYLPKNLIEDCVLYTGTHDNNTTLGWYQSLDEAHQALVHQVIAASAKLDLIRLPDSFQSMPWSLIGCALASVATYCIIPMQDVLALGSEHRTNTPGTRNNNWRWRFSWSQLPLDLIMNLHTLNKQANRL